MPCLKSLLSQKPGSWAPLSSAFPCVALSFQFKPQSGSCGEIPDQVTNVPPVPWAVCGQGTFSCSGRIESKVSFALQAELNSLSLGQRHQKRGSKGFPAASLSQNCSSQELLFPVLSPWCYSHCKVRENTGSLSPSLLLE